MRGKRKHIAARGFTLIELLIVIAIIGVVTSVTLVGYAQQRDARVVRTAARDVAAAARMAQHYAVAGYRWRTDVMPCRFVFFADPVQRAYGVRGIGTAGGGPTCGETRELLRRTLPHGARFAAAVTVTFLLPHGTVAGGTAQQVVVRRADAARTVCIGAGGQITEGC